MLMLSVLSIRCLCYRIVVSCFLLNLVLMLLGSYIFENLNITIKPSTFDYNEERDLSSIINRIQSMRIFGGAWIYFSRAKQRVNFLQKIIKS
jgi:hypothetical protein